MAMIRMQAEAQEYLASCNCPDYLRKAEKRLAEESERVRNYLDPGSDSKITRVVESELIQKQVRLGGASVHGNDISQLLLSAVRLPRCGPLCTLRLMVFSSTRLRLMVFPSTRLQMKVLLA